MTADPFAIDASSGSPAYSGADLRLGVIVPLAAGAGVSIGVRSGVRWSGSTTDLLVQAQVTPNMTVQVRTGAAIIQGTVSSGQGGYGYALDAVTNVTIATAHATLDRTDLICIRVRDANVDTSGGRDGGLVAITGTNGGGVPSVPTDATYYTLAQVFVQHAVSSITSGAITDKRAFTTASGGIIPTLSATQESALGTTEPTLSYRTDLHALRHYHAGVSATVSPGQVLLDKRTLAVDSANITFSGISQEFSHLRLVGMLRSTRAANTSDTAILQVNGDTGSHYEWSTNVINNAGVGAANGVSTDTAARFMQAVPAATATANVFGRITIDFPFYAETALLAKSFIANGAGPSWPIQQGSGNWIPTAAAGIASIVLTASSGNLKAGTIFCLYGMS